jgi:hypothetical protein
MALPMPPDAPVTMAVFLCCDMIVFLSLNRKWVCRAIRPGP